MKNILVVIILLFSTNLFSQSLPNSDMEDWDNYLFYWEPDDWFTLNPFILLGGGTIAVERSSDAYSGNYSAKISTSGITVNEQAVVVPGILTLAEFNLNMSDTTFSFTGGYFLQENVKFLRGYYKYSGGDDDSASVLIYNYKNDEGVMDTIGFGFGFLGNTDEWTAFEVEMININDAVPDTFNVLFSSSTSVSPQVGSALYIDSISIETNTGIIDLWNRAEPMQVYPNPASDRITFRSKTADKGRILTIYDNFGKHIGEYTFDDLEQTITLNDVASGVYIYKLTEGTKLLNRGSFIKN
jgi:hypothetical protein